MLPRLLAILLVLQISKGLAQVNLVPNPSFEEYSICPSSAGALNASVSWSSPTFGSPDYFNSCSSPSQFSTPNNFFGSQVPHIGSSYVGIGPYIMPVNNFREYIQTKLTQKLKNNKTYCVELYVSLAGLRSQYATNNMGVVLSEEAISNFSNISMLTNTPSINWDIIVSDTSNWVKLSGIYLANGNEEYITIGNFYYNEQTDTFRLNENDEKISYYYIDDVSVVECELQIKIPDVFTPNGDEFNPYFKIEYLPKNSNLTIYNRWGKQVYQSNNYQNDWDGENHSSGVYYYILTLPTGEVKKGTVTILRE